MFGYATDETAELMPLTHMLATQIGYKLTEVRKNGTVGWLRPDGKTQVTVEYKKVDGAMVPQRVHTILISTQHSPGGYCTHTVQARALSTMCNIFQVRSKKAYQGLDVHSLIVLLCAASSLVHGNDSSCQLAL